MLTARIPFAGTVAVLSDSELLLLTFSLNDDLIFHYDMFEFGWPGSWWWRGV